MPSFSKTGLNWPLSFLWGVGTCHGYNILEGEPGNQRGTWKSTAPKLGKKSIFYSKKWQNRGCKMLPFSETGLNWPLYFLWGNGTCHGYNILEGKQCNQRESWKIFALKIGKN